jgi:molybdopterin synthase catalytic subunit
MHCDNDKEDSNKESYVNGDSLSIGKDLGQGDHLDNDHHRITTKEIDIDSILKSVGTIGDTDSTTIGATVLFIGSVRNFGNEGQVQSMKYESYMGMAEERIKDIEKIVKKKWDIKKIKIIHRIGELALGENSIAIAISTSHSKDAFEACNFALYKIKQEVPIWKNEKLADGRLKWVDGKPMEKY